MADGARDIVAHETYLARRLGRLFRLERDGRLAGRSAQFRERLVRRRGELIAALLKTDAARRDLRTPISPDLRRAAEALWGETGQSLRSTDARLQELRADLLIARGEGIPSGIRGSVGGRILGQG